MKLSILAIETSTQACSASLLIRDTEGNINTTNLFEIAPQKHTELLLPMLDQVLEQGEIKFSNIDLLAYGHGPGAFTGVRIATSVIKSLAYAQDKPIASISSLAALAQSCVRLQLIKDRNASNAVIVINDARMNEVYIACYYTNEAGQMVNFSDEKLIKPSEITQYVASFCQNFPYWFGVGSGWDVFKEELLPLISSNQCEGINSTLLPDAQDVAYLALDKHEQHQLETSFSALPNYLRNNIATPSQ